jgi:hypothetical protein
LAFIAIHPISHGQRGNSAGICIKNQIEPVILSLEPWLQSLAVEARGTGPVHSLQRPLLACFAMQRLQYQRAVR